MSVTDTAAALTAQFRVAQMQLRARALRDFLKLWPIWHADDSATFGLLVTATLPLVRTYRDLSATLAASYYEAFRTAEGITGVATPRITAALTDAQLTTSLYVTGQVAEQKAMLAGQTLDEARNTALLRTSGALTRYVLQGGRDTMLASVQADKQALGWARVTDGKPCAFCAMLAGRGPVYKSDETADFRAHDHCGCVAEPFYKGSSWPGRAREFNGLYNQAIREATASGELDRGTENDQLNAFRRFYTGR